MFDLLIKFPTRSRPDKFRNQFDRYYNMLSGKRKVKFVVSMDEDDATMNNYDMQWWLSPGNGGRQNIFYYYGHSKTKIQAINADMKDHQDFKVLLLASDDMTPIKQGYDDIICSDMEKYFPDKMGALHYDDGRVGRDLNTLVVMNKSLYDYFGYIYHPSYVSVWCDNEFHEATYNMGCAVFVPRVIIKHDWVNYTGKDSLHCRNESFYPVDEATFRRRRNIRFNPTAP